MSKKSSRVKVRHSPGIVRDAIVAYLDTTNGDAGVLEIKTAVEAKIGEVPASSVRSYLWLRPDRFVRTRQGRYQIKKESETDVPTVAWEYEWKHDTCLESRKGIALSCRLFRLA